MKKMIVTIRDYIREMKITIKFQMYSLFLILRATLSMESVNNAKMLGRVSQKIIFSTFEWNFLSGL